MKLAYREKISRLACSRVRYSRRIASSSQSARRTSSSFRSSLLAAGAPRTARHQPRHGQAPREQGVVVPAGGQVRQEVDAHELLGEGRPTLGKPQPKPGAVPPLRERARHRLLDHPRQRAVVDPRVRVEVLVLGRQDGLAHDQGHFVVGHHPPVLPRELDHDLSPGVRDLARRGRLEEDERSELGKVAAVEVDVVDEGEWRPERQGRGDHRRGDAHGPVRPGGSQAAGDRHPRGPQAARRGDARGACPARGERALPPQPPPARGGLVVERAHGTGDCDGLHGHDPRLPQRRLDVCLASLRHSSFA